MKSLQDIKNKILVKIDDMEPQKIATVLVVSFVLGFIVCKMVS